MDFDLDLQTKLRGKALDALWSKLKTDLLAKLNTFPTSQHTPELIDSVCLIVASDLDLTYHRNDNWLYFCDHGLAPN